MSNMSYCRFQNTKLDLEECLDSLNSELSKDETRARRELYELCQAYCEEYQRLEDIASNEDASELL